MGLQHPPAICISPQQRTATTRHRLPSCRSGCSHLCRQPSRVNAARWMPSRNACFYAAGLQRVHAFPYLWDPLKALDAPRCSCNAPTIVQSKSRGAMSHMPIDALIVCHGITPRSYLVHGERSYTLFYRYHHPKYFCTATFKGTHITPSLGLPFRIAFLGTPRRPNCHS